MQGIETAGRALRRFQRAGAIASAVPTPERLLRACGTAEVERTIRTVAIVQDGAPNAVAVDGHRIRITDSVFGRLTKRGHLGANPDRNRILAEAGLRYHKDWTLAGLEPIQGQDPGKIRSSAAPAGLLVPEKKYEAFKRYSAASDSMDRLDRIAVEWVVLHDRPLEEVGRRIYSGNHQKVRVGIAAHQLRIGLEKLAIHYGLLVIEPDLEDA